jgi:hypothetical protein
VVADAAEVPPAIALVYVVADAVTPAMVTVEELSGRCH